MYICVCVCLYTHICFSRFFCLKAYYSASFVAQLAKILPAMLETCVQSLGWEGPLEEGMATHSSILAWRIPWTGEFHGFIYACICPWNAIQSMEWFMYIYVHGMLYSHISEKAMASHSSTLAWKIPWMEEPGGLQSMGLLRVGHDWATSLSLFTFMHWRRKWQPTPVFLPWESQGRWSLVGSRLWGCTESRLKWLSSMCIYICVCVHIYAFSDYFPLKIIIRYWVELPVLYSKSLLVIYFIYSRKYILISNS